MHMPYRMIEGKKASKTSVMHEDDQTVHKMCIMQENCLSIHMWITLTEFKSARHREQIGIKYVPPNCWVPGTDNKLPILNVSSTSLLLNNLSDSCFHNSGVSTKCM